MGLLDGMKGMVKSDVSKIKLVWDPNPCRPFIPGEEVNGKAILVTDKDEVKIQKATIKLEGEVFIRWVEVSQKRTTYVYITFKII